MFSGKAFKNSFNMLFYFVGKLYRLIVKIKKYKKSTKKKKQIEATIQKNNHYCFDTHTWK